MRANSDTPRRIALAPPLTWWIVPIFLSWLCVLASSGGLVVVIVIAVGFWPSRMPDSPWRILADLSLVAMIVVGMLLLTVLGILLGWIGSIGDPTRSRLASQANAWMPAIYLVVLLLALMLK
jgi:hypothetical protein